jgi:hypothetical protein
MAHYAMEKWIDFVRGTSGDRERAAMQSHLEYGCKQCSETLSLWKHVYDAVQRDRAMEVPETAVRAMKAMFAIHGPRRRQPKLAIAQLLFDSALSPLQAGVRSSSSSARQMLFGVGTYRVDLRMEPKHDSSKVAVTGQVLHPADPAEMPEALPVALLKGGRVVAETVTSRFGEFNLECDQEGRFHLRVKLPGEVLQLALVEPILPSAPLLALAADSKRVKKPPHSRKKRTKGRY